jgi:dTDP-D-glucose 4,6-dehydratase
MRDKKWVLEHRGGSLKIGQQKLLMKWSIECVNHLLPLLNNNINEKIINAINIGNNWIIGKANTGDTIKISREIIKYVRTLNDELEILITRAAGHAVATAHMADHSMGTVKYCIDAIKIIGGSIEKEVKWQIKNIPNGLEELVLEGLRNKNIINDSVHRHIA